MLKVLSFTDRLGSIIILLIIFFSKKKISTLVKFKNFKVVFLRSIFGTTAMYFAIKH